MRAEVWAFFTAICWGLGSMLEKKGVKMGGFTPVMGTMIRTTFSLMFMAVVTFPFWGQVKMAGVRSISLIAVGGGFLAGGLGIVCLYTGLKTGSLSTVMTIAFCLAPVVGASLGFFFLHERLSSLQMLGIAFCVIGAAIVTYLK